MVISYKQWRFLINEYFDVYEYRISCDVYVAGKLVGLRVTFYFNCSPADLDDFFKNLLRNIGFGLVKSEAFLASFWDDFVYYQQYILGRQVIPEEQVEITEEDTEPSLLPYVVVNPDVNPKWQPEYTPTNECPAAEKSQINNDGRCRVQDRELLEMADSGACLSLHQPWASLVVYGIKKHEGRSWYTSHRGRLWIAAAAKQPSDLEIKEIEDFYRLLFPGTEFSFPKHYPTSCLLGCVTVTDCLTQEEYQSRFETKESESPFVFILQDARALSLKFPMSGQHKIYKLEKQIHLAAQKALMRLENNKSV